MYLISEKFKDTLLKKTHGLTLSKFLPTKLDLDWKWNLSALCFHKRNIIFLVSDKKNEVIELSLIQVLALSCTLVSKKWWHCKWRKYAVCTTICVQPWSVSGFSHMFTFQTCQFPRQLCRLNQWKCFIWSMKLCELVKQTLQVLFT